MRFADIFSSFFSSRAILIVRLGFLTGLYNFLLLNSAQFVYLTSVYYLYPTIPINDQKFKCFHDLWLHKLALVCLWNDYDIFLFLFFFFSLGSQIDLLCFFTVTCLVLLLSLSLHLTLCCYFMLFPSCCSDYSGSKSPENDVEFMELDENSTSPLTDSEESCR